MDATVFFYDWNYDGTNHFWPGLIYSDDYRPYIRQDLSEDELANGDDDGETQFNDDNTRGKSYLTAQYLANGSPYTNKDYLTHVFLTRASQPIGYTAAGNVWFDTGLMNGPADTSAQGKIFEASNNFYMYTCTGYLICGISATKGVLDFSYCTTSNLAYDSVNKQFKFKYNGELYDLYSSELINGTYAKVNNLAVFDVDGTIMLLIPPTPGKYVSAVPVQYQKKSDGSIVNAKRTTTEITAMYADIRDVDRLNVYETTPASDAKGQLSAVTFYKSEWTYESHHVWVKDLRKQYPPKLNNAKAEDVLDNALSEPSNPWKTPAEFYTDWKPTTKIVKGPNGFVRAFGRVFGKKYKSTVVKETMPIWFWCNTLRNWCTYKHTRHHTLELFLWNGQNGWDKATDIIVPLNKRSNVMAKYYYDVKRFIRGTFVSARINYNQMYYAWRTIKLTDDTKFSQYDEDTFQTVKLGKTYLNNKGTRRYPFSVGIPPVFRSAAGEIMMMYYMRIPGMQWWSELVYKEHLDFINSVCQAYFGKGDDKTIAENWKRYSWVKDSSEEHSTRVVTDEDSTLIYQPEINTIREDNEILDISFTIPRQYPETANGTDEAYVEEWSK